MPINSNLKLIFVHVPKTAGTSFEYALGMHGARDNIGLMPYTHQQKNMNYLFGGGLQHLTAKEILTSVGKYTFSSFFKFSIIRNPYERFVSFVAWNQPDKSQTLTRKEFVDFIDRSKHRFRFIFDKMLYPQCKFLYIRKNLAVDLLIRYEKLNEGVAMLEKQLNKKMTIDKRMCSNHEEFKYYYDSRSYKLIQSIYRRDFYYFGYDI